MQHQLQRIYPQLSRQLGRISYLRIYHVSVHLLQMYHAHRILKAHFLPLHDNRNHHPSSLNLSNLGHHLRHPISLVQIIIYSCLVKYPLPQHFRLQLHPWHSPLLLPIQLSLCCHNNSAWTPLLCLHFRRWEVASLCHRNRLNLRQPDKIVCCPRTIGAILIHCHRRMSFTPLNIPQIRQSWIFMGFVYLDSTFCILSWPPSKPFSMIFAPIFEDIKFASLHMMLCTPSFINFI